MREISMSCAHAFADYVSCHFIYYFYSVISFVLLYFLSFSLSLSLSCCLESRCHCCFRLEFEWPARMRCSLNGRCAVCGSCRLYFSLSNFFQLIYSCWTADRVRFRWAKFEFCCCFFSVRPARHSNFPSAIIIEMSHFKWHARESRTKGHNHTQIP